MSTVEALPAVPIERPRVVSIGTTLAVIGTVMYFAGLIGLYLFERSAAVEFNRDWLPSDNIPLMPGHVMMMTLVMSVVTIQWAFYAIVRNDRTNAYVALGLTLLFGIATINAQSYMYTQMGLSIDESVASLLVYVITGSFLAMLLGAMAFVAIVAFRALGGQYTEHQHDGLAAACLYWYATVAVFSVIWIAVYITK